MCREIATRIDEDDAVGITATWHDESHFNAYCQNHPPERILPPAFAYPEDLRQAQSWGLAKESPVIIALDKNHDAYRYGFMRRQAINLRSLVGKLLRRAGLRTGRQT
jgi:hypothetical protein